MAGFQPGAQIIGCETNEAPKPDVLHHGGMNVNLYVVQPFAICRSDGGVSVILINKYNEPSRTAAISVPDGMESYEIFRYDQNRIANCFSPIESGQTGQSVTLECPPFSVSVVKFSTTSAVEKAPEKYRTSGDENLLSNFPNPFNSCTQINYRVQKSGVVELIVLNLLGQKVRSLFDGTQAAGDFQLLWDGKDNAGNFVSGGIYLISLKTSGQIERQKALYLK